MALDKYSFQIHILCLHIESWIARGIASLEDLYDGSLPKTFIALQNKTYIIDYFQYLQILHLIKPVTSKQCAVPSRVLSLMIAPSNQNTRGSTIFCNLLTFNDLFSKTPNIIKWEAELGRQFTPSQWSMAIRWAHNSSDRAIHREQYQKLLTRWYFTPLR